MDKESLNNIIKLFVALNDDLAEIDKNYHVVGVCACHAFKGLSS